VQDSAKGRAAFHNKFFKVDVDNPALYHLVLNTARLTPDDAAQLIAAPCRTSPRSSTRDLQSNDGLMFEGALIVFVSYLIGAVPVVPGRLRLLRGIDIRDYGSGNLGPSNIWQNVSKPATIPVGLIEIGQAAAGILIAKATGQSHDVQVLAGIAALGAHNWCLVLGLDGGRGVGFAIGFMLVLSWPALGAFVAIALAGVVLRGVPQFVALGLVSARLGATANQRPEIVAGRPAVAALTC
jgi:glycerol-3-phosphate acyltransferase PlsY